MRYYAREETEMPYIIVKKDKIVGVNDAFLVLTGFECNEIFNKPFSILWSSLLRINIDPKPIIDEAFMFTKGLDARCISVHVQENSYHKELIYWFNELPDSRFEEKNQFISKLITENLVGVGIYDAHDFKLLKANQTYLDYLPISYHTKEFAYGKTLGNLISGFEGSAEEELWKTTVQCNRSVYEREKTDLLLTDYHGYWNRSLTPIDENGRVKYIVSILENITECVQDNNRIMEQTRTIKQQKDQLEAVVNNLSCPMSTQEITSSY